MHLVVTSSSSPLDCHSFLDLPRFYLLDNFEGTTQVFCRMFLNWDLSHVFLMIRLGLWVSGSQTSKISDISYRITGICCQHDITVAFNLGPLTEVVVVRLLHCKVALLPTPTPIPFWIALLGRKRLHAAHTSGVRVLPP